MYNGVTPATLAVDVCVKVEANALVCRPCETNSGVDHTRCTPYVGGFQSICQDEPGKWAAKKCPKKLYKGKCHKRRVRRFCKKSCGLCTHFVG